MERLEPVLKQKFWILLGVTLIMAIVGWWLSTAAMAKTIAERQSQIEAAFKKVPEGAVPNENWVKELNALNSNQETAIAVAKSASWKQQRDRMMQWPDGVQPSGYWGKFSTVARDQIRRGYEREVRRVWKTLDPLDPEDEDKPGVVFYPAKRMYEVVMKPWQSGFKKDDDTLWQTKEDLWLLERLFQTIVSVNGGMGVTQNEAVLHTIDRLELRGGGGPKPAPGSSGGGQPNSGISTQGMRVRAMLDSKKDADDYPSGNVGMNVPDTTGPTTRIDSLSAEFDAAEEFGTDGSGGARMMTADPTMDASAPVPGINRYVSDDESLPYKTRGFYLSVKMDHRKIPALIAELTANENTILPIEVMRVQMSRIHEDAVSNYTTPAAGAVPMANTRTPFNNAPNRMGRPMSKNDDEDVPSFGNFGGMRPPVSVGVGSTRQPGTTSTAMTAEERAFEAHQAEISQALATYEKVIADPVMAQVTICGVFILFRKVDDVARPSAEGSPKEAAMATPAAATTTVTETPSDASPTTAETPAATTDAPATEGEAAAATANSTEEGTTESTDATAEPASNPEPASTDDAGAAAKETEPRK